MATALTLYLTNTNDTLLTSGRQLVANTTGAANVGVDTKLGTATGWGEIVSQGSAATWPALGAEGAPSGKGYIWDVTTLEGQGMLSGTWTPTIRVTFNGANANATVDFHFRIYRYNGGVYTLLGESTTTGQTISTTSTTYTLSGVSIGATNFNSGDKIYIDLWVNVTANSNTATAATFRLNEASSTTQGNATNQIVTPGYTPQVQLSATPTAVFGASASLQDKHLLAATAAALFNGSASLQDKHLLTATATAIFNGSATLQDKKLLNAVAAALFGGYANLSVLRGEGTIKLTEQTLGAVKLTEQQQGIVLLSDILL